MADGGKGILQPGAVALVTGASSGIGAATAELLAGRGARVICIGRNRARLGAVVGRLGERGFALELDVTDAAATASLLERLPEELRAIDILINNSGHDVGGRQRFDQGDVEDWASIVETNVIGMIRITHAIVPGMLARGRGHIVNIGSTAGQRVPRHAGVYSASKFAVRAFTEGLRADYADTDLRITEILPGITRTGLAQARFHGDEVKGAAYYEGFPATMAPGDVARTVLFALDQPPHVTIAQLVVVTTRGT
jgi:3-hydroxy acid dehydrogenase/malonic semialdehyde reductase